MTMEDKEYREAAGKNDSTIIVCIDPRMLMGLMSKSKNPQLAKVPANKKDISPNSAIIREGMSIAAFTGGKRIAGRDQK